MPGPRAADATDNTSLQRIQAQLRADQAVVAWIDIDTAMPTIAGVRTHWACIVKHTGKPQWIPLDIVDADLPARAAAALSSRPVNGTQRENLLSALREQHFAPLDAHLTDIDHLIVLPGDLAGIPIEVLTTRHTVSYAPSATILAWLLEYERPVAQRTLLAVGNPQLDPDHDLPELPGAGLEVRAIARHFPADTATILLRQAASEQRLTALSAAGTLQHFGYVHFATHGVLDNAAPWRSALILAQPAEPTDIADLLNDRPLHDDRLTAAQIMSDWQLGADLVILSGCETALGAPRGGEGFLGFSQALFVAGARSLVLSLWQVDDRATTLLMHRFYQNLLGTSATPRHVGDAKYAAGAALPKRAALHEAQRWLQQASPAANRALLAELGFDLSDGAVTRGVKISRERPRIPFDYSDPHYWAAFILVGDFD